jgi:hypothetical protein
MKKGLTYYYIMTISNVYRRRGHKLRNVILEAGKDRETDSHLEPPEGALACQHLDFGPVKLILDLWPPDCKRIRCVVLSHQVRAHLL